MEFTSTYACMLHGLHTQRKLPQPLLRPVLGISFNPNHGGTTSSINLTVQYGEKNSFVVLTFGER